MDILDEEIKLERIGERRYSCNITDNYTVHDGTFGGQILALVAQAMVQETDRARTPIISASFIRRCDIGPAEITVEIISSSRQFDRLEARIYQGGKERVRAHGLFREEPGVGTVTRYEQKPPEIAPLEECVKLEHLPTYNLFGSIDLFLDPRCTGWLVGEPGEVSEMMGWFSYPTDRPYDIPAVALAADALPPPVYATHGLVAWVPTLEIMVSIRNIPTSRFLKCDFRTRFIDAGLVEEDGELWSEDNELVAVSRQIAQFRLPV